MNLATVYKDVTKRNEIDYFLKKEFGRNAVKFLKTACKLAGVTPDGKVYHNKGGDAIWGEVICNVKHPVKNRVLEICLGESGPFYRSNGEGGFGPNLWILFLNVSPIEYVFLAKYTEDILASVIKSFLENTNPRLF